MGLAVSNSRLLLLTARASDLQFQILQINEKEERLAYQAAAIYEEYSQKMQLLLNSNLDIPDTVREQDYTFLTNSFEVIQQQIQLQDKQYETEKANIDTQNKAVTTEMESVKKMIDKNIEMSFKAFSS